MFVWQGEQHASSIFLLGIPTCFVENNLLMQIPFYPNTGDGTHCFQAVMMMALGFFVPDRNFSYDELDRISCKKSGLWTWPTAAMLWMIERGFQLKLIEDFDYNDFAQRGNEYLLERYGEEVGRAQIEHSDVECERDISRRFADVAPIEKRPAGLEDIRTEMASGAVVIVNLNAAALLGQEGYSGHFVVICDVSDAGVTLHDPGLPPRSDLQVTLARFLNAWGYPSGRDRNVMSIALPEGTTFREDDAC
jgi:hypothetical protein